jgi:hypothetical protein
MQHEVPEVHKTQVVRILAGFSGGVAVSKPKPGRISDEAYSRPEIYAKASIRPRAVRRALTALEVEGLVLKTRATFNSPTGLDQQDRFQLNLQKADELVDYIDFASPRSRSTTAR